jgi:hypothetical protein
MSPILILTAREGHRFAQSNRDEPCQSCIASRAETNSTCRRRRWALRSRVRCAGGRCSARRVIPEWTLTKYLRTLSFMPASGSRPRFSFLPSDHSATGISEGQTPARKLGDDGKRRDFGDRSRRNAITKTSCRFSPFAFVCWPCSSHSWRSSETAADLVQENRSGSRGTRGETERT